MTSHPAPIGGPLMTRTFRVLLAFIAIGALLVLWRAFVGLGPVTGMNDGYPFGLWIAFDVVVGTALATGGYGMAILIYVLNKGKYHPLVRSALVTSALGYSLAGISVLIDLGRYWNVWKLPLMPWAWNLESVLLEVALCIMLYTVVVWIELSPAIFERWAHARQDSLRRFAARATPVVKRAFPWLIALGILLPTMHQSSLGSLMLLAGFKLHPLWQTPLLPLLFLVSCLFMGWAAVTIESTLATRLFGLRSEDKLLSRLTAPIALVLALYTGIRVVDLVARGRLGLMFALDGYSLLFLLEMMFALVPLTVVVARRYQLGAQTLFRLAMLMIVGGGLYRFSVFLIAYDPGPSWGYFPAVAELMITIGILSFEIAAYLALVKVLPILAARPRRAPAFEPPLPSPAPAVPAGG